MTELRIFAQEPWHRWGAAKGFSAGTIEKLRRARPLAKLFRAGAGERSWKKAGGANRLAGWWFAVGFMGKRWWAVGGSNPKPSD